MKRLTVVGGDGSACNMHVSYIHIYILQSTQVYVVRDFSHFFFSNVGHTNIVRLLTAFVLCLYSKHLLVVENIELPSFAPSLDVNAYMMSGGKNCGQPCGIVTQLVRRSCILTLYADCFRAVQ